MPSSTLKRSSFLLLFKHSVYMKCSIVFFTFQSSFASSNRKFIVFLRTWISRYMKLWSAAIPPVSHGRLQEFKRWSARRGFFQELVWNSWELMFLCSNVTGGILLHTAFASESISCYQLLYMLGFAKHDCSLLISKG